MKKLISINISGTSYFIDEDAYEKLSLYLEKLKKRFQSEEEGEEIIADVETRLSELFAERINPKTGVITTSMVEEVVKIMGQPEDFSENDEEYSKKATPDNEPEATSRRSLYRDGDNRVLGGVCAGIAAYFNIDPVFVRVIFAIMPFLSFGIAIPIYIVLWIVVPTAVTTTQKMEMKGENITISNIEKNVKEEFEHVKKRFENFNKSYKTNKKGDGNAKKMNNRDTTLLIVGVSIILLMIVGRLIGGFHGHFHFPNFTTGTFLFPGFIQLAILLLALGLIFRSSLKGFVIVIILIAAVAIFAKLMAWIFGGAFFFNNFFNIL